jgi:hypothetical protein
MFALIPIAIALGLFGGAFVGYLVAVRLVRRIASMGRLNIVSGFASATGLLALLPAGFVAFVAGGNLGGAWAETVLGPLGVALGIALGVGLLLAVLLCIAAVIGAGLGVVVSRALGKRRAA